MRMFISIPDGMKTADFIEEGKGRRIGNRIRAVRIDRGMSQAELGKAVGLTADRVQKYENGIRTPKFELIKKFASALEVDTLALVDPVVSNYIGAMFAFFEMEEIYQLEVKKVDGKFLLQFGNCSINDFLEDWYEEKEYVRILMENATEEEKKTIIKNYDEWKRTFPEPICNKIKMAKQKARIKSAIEELQNRLKELDDEENNFKPKPKQ